MTTSYICAGDVLYKSDNPASKAIYAECSVDWTTSTAANPIPPASIPDAQLAAQWFSGGFAVITSVLVIVVTFKVVFREVNEAWRNHHF